MNLQTERLYLNPVSTDDLHAIHALHSLPETDRYNTLGIPESIEVTEEIVAGWLIAQHSNPPASYIFSLHTNHNDEFIGLIGLKMGKPTYRSAEVWFKTHKDFWNKGYTTEALRKILAFAFNDLSLHRIEAGCAVENIASAKVLEKSGFKKEGMKRKILPISSQSIDTTDGQRWRDNYFYAILEEDFA